MSSHFSFPSPIGGVSFESDFAPSILFAVIYGVLVMIALVRAIRPTSRTATLINTISFAIERVVIFGLRAEQAKSDSARTSHNLMIYMQTTLSIAYISVANDILVFLRCLISAATLSDVRARLTGTARLGSVIPGNYPSRDEIMNERAKERKRYREYHGWISLFYFIPLILGTIAGFKYTKAEDNESQVGLVQGLRYATGVTSFLFIAFIQIFAIYAATAIRGIKRRSVWLLFCLATLLNVVSVYRLIVMHFYTTSVTSTAPGSLNSTKSKITFYIFHIAPEWITSAILLSINARQTFETGLWGDALRPMEKQLVKESSAQ